MLRNKEFQAQVRDAFPHADWELPFDQSQGAPVQQELDLKTARVHPSGILGTPPPATSLGLNLRGASVCDCFTITDREDFVCLVRIPLISFP